MNTDPPYEFAASLENPVDEMFNDEPVTYIAPPLTALLLSNLEPLIVDVTVVGALSAM